MTILRSVSLSWIGTVALAFTYLAVGKGVDEIRIGAAIHGGTLTVLIVCPVIAGAAAWAGMAPWPRHVTETEKSVRARMMRAVLGAVGQRQDDQWSGGTVSTATDGVERYAAYRETFVGPMIAAITGPILAALIIGWRIDWRSGLILLAAIALIPILIGGFQSAFRRVSTQYRGASRRLAARYLDAIQGLSVLRALGAGKQTGRRLAAEAENVRRKVMALLAGNQLVLLVTDAAFSLGMITVAGLLAVDGAASRRFSPGEAVALVLVSTLLLEPLDRIGQFFYVGMGGMAAQREIKKFIADESPAPAATRARAGARTHARGASPQGGTQAAIVVRDVHFGYEPGAEILAGANVTVATGEHVAVMGPSGCGKSTLLALVQGLLTPQAGTVCVAGVDVRDAYPRWAQDHIAVVEQKTYLFTGTLAYNLRMAAPDATDEQLWQALAAANLTEVESWPRGLETPCGERGLSLSGGQAQRLAIARAVLRDAPILLLDEPTSQVDVASEELIVDSLQRLARGRAVLSVTHRTRTARAADRVVELHGGKITDLADLRGA
ncbi:ABC transporter ATP-binding protein/permease [Rarobacter incanus]|uniref:ABC-type transport system involved in cytochrome bd biosynthesis fused ATPase/permease subunit n=1 Tax=Rarobacter incanus TaxID=153494 RepID=A0A542SPL5_9MICO|nr:ABC transporter ATP-binding protein [Rarobacter incanus]TQK76559.1 ABC-type transport system involved in cytochrome bd biosynthesis fused ATPase/permease subunit [Rarobacter incanus]